MGLLTCPIVLIFETCVRSLYVRLVFGFFLIHFNLLWSFLVYFWFIRQIMIDILTKFDLHSEILGSCLIYCRAMISDHVLQHRVTLEQSPLCARGAPTRRVAAESFKAPAGWRKMNRKKPNAPISMNQSRFSNLIFTQYSKIAIQCFFYGKSIFFAVCCWFRPIIGLGRVEM